MGTMKFRKTDYFDVYKLRQQYSPLIANIYNFFSKYNYVWYNSKDYEDLRAQIELEFMRLCREYNPARGVDFPGFIKFHLQQRVYHWVMKLKDYRKAEVTYSRGYDNYEGDSEMDFENLKEMIDYKQVDLHEKAEALASIDYSILPSDKHRRLVEQVLLEKKSLESIAYYNKEALKVVKARFNECCNCLYGYMSTRNNKESYEKFLARIKFANVSFDMYNKNPKYYDSLKRVACKFERIPLKNFSRTPLNLMRLPSKADEEVVV